MFYDILKYKYEHGVLDRFDLMRYVEENMISEEEYYMITDYSYNGVKKGKSE